MKKPNFSYGWFIVAAAFLICIVAYGVQYSFGIFFEPLEQEFGWSATETSSVFSLYLILHCLFGFLAGWAIDRYSPRLIVTVGGILLGLGLFLNSKTTTIWQLYIYYGLLVGLGVASVYNPIITTTTRWFEQRRGLAVGIVTAGMGVGTIIFAPLANYFNSTYDWRHSYFFIAIIAWVVVIAAAQFLKGSSHERLMPQGAKDKTEFEGLSLKQALTTGDLWLLFGAYFFFTFCLLMVMGHLPKYAISLGIPPATAATFVSVIGGASVIGRLGMGAASDRIGPKKIIIICAFLQALMMFYLMKAHDVSSFYLFAFIFGIAYGGRAATMAPFIAGIFGVRHMGTILGVVLIVAGIGEALGPLVAGYLLDTTKSYSLAFFIAAAGILLAIAFIFPIKERGKLTSS